MADAAVQLDPADTETEAAPPKRLDLIPRGLGALEAKLRRDLSELNITQHVAEQAPPCV